MGIAGAVALVALLIGAPGSALAASTCPGENGKIAAAGTNGLAVIGEGGGVRWLVQGAPSYTYEPSFSCNGKLVAYIGDDETTCPPMEIVNVLTGKRRLFQYGSSRRSGFPTGGCAFAPTFLRGGRLLFGVSARGKVGTYVASSDGRHRHRLFDSPVCASTADASWFVSCYSRTLVLRNSQGRVVRTLTPLPGVRRIHYLNPSFSPDGHWIVYSRTVDTPAGGSYDRSDVYLVRRDGTHRQRLTDDGRSFDPTFSPDGHWIAFTRGEEVVRHEMMAMPRAHPGRVKLLAKVNSSLRSPSWGPR
ncbi:MAG: TolB family protein [Solirubrobacterales bacterium]